jgi:hypothetical protein
MENVRIITLAPELNNAMKVIEELTQRGITVSLGKLKFLKDQGPFSVAFYHYILNLMKSSTVLYIFHNQKHSVTKKVCEQFRFITATIFQVSAISGTRTIMALCFLYRILVMVLASFPDVLYHSAVLSILQPFS